MTMRKTTHKLILFASLIALGTACSGADEMVDENGALVTPLPDLGKADSYISTNAREYLLSGTAHVILPDGFAELVDEARQEALDRAVDSRMSRVASAIKSTIDNVLKEANGGGLGEKEKWFVYIRRNADDDAATNVEVLEDGKARFDFEMELVGSYYLMSKVAPENGTSERSFQITVTDWSHPEFTENISVGMRGSESKDAFPRYDKLFEDGVFDIAIHFGGDYNKERHDLETCKWLIETMIEAKWENPQVSKFEDLRIDSPPFTNKVHVNGKEVEVQVYVYHSDMVEVADEAQLEEVMKASFAARDVVVYSGHAGEGAGFLLDYQPRYELKASDFATLPLADKYQIFAFDGCRTYRSYVDDMMKNPAKTWENVDIITTVNTTPFSAGYYLLWEFLHWFTLTDNAGEHYPLSWKTILRGVNKPQFADVHYGVHGVDGGPQLNPHAPDAMCKPCTSDTDCGPGNLCLGYTGGAACGVACTNDAACGSEARCARLTQDDDLFYIPKQCVQRDYVCGN